MSENEGDTMGTIVPFPTPLSRIPSKGGGPREVRSAVAEASASDDARKTMQADEIDKLLTQGKLANAEDLFRLIVNLRDFIYGLKEVGLLNPALVGTKVWGDHDGGQKGVKRIQGYLAPQGVSTYADMVSKHPKRKPASKPSGYIKVLMAAAKLADVDLRDAKIALVKGTCFQPGAETTVDGERQACAQIMSILAKVAQRLNRVGSLSGYFSQVHSRRVVPLGNGDDPKFGRVEEFEWWEHTAIPAVPLATKWAESYAELKTVLLVVSDDPATSTSTNVNFDALMNALSDADSASDMTLFEAKIGMRRTFSLGFSPIGSDLAAVAIKSHEVILQC